jgi:hypothetical protein
MKTRYLIAVLAALSLARGADSGAPPSATFVDPDSPDVAEIRALGERAINRLAVTLVNEVAVAVSKGGAEKAVEVCHLKALPLTGEIVSGLPRITAVKRTSLRLRNPANAPDPADQLALKKVEKDIGSGVVPKVLVQRIDLPAGQAEWRVYRPVGVAAQCVACHGSPEDMPPGLQARLAERYPSDQATGYSAGQWRGLIRVTVSDTPPPAPPSTKTTAPAPAKKRGA